MNIRELAQIAGVSKTTAAYALKNNPRVSMETCQRIQELARKHGYATNPNVNSFMREVRQGKVNRHRHNIAYISSLGPDGKSRRLSHSNEAELIRGAQVEAGVLGCDLDIIDWSLDLDEQVRLSQIIDARGIQAIFIGPAVSPNTKIEIKMDRIAVLCSGYSVGEPPLDRTACDLFTSIFNAGKRAIDRNYERIVIAMNDHSNEHVGWRWLSAAATLRELHGERIHVLRGVPATMAPTVIELKNRGPRMALLGHSDLYVELIDRGIQFPRDMGFVAFDMMTPDITAIAQPHFESGRRGLRYLYNAIENGNLGIPKQPCRLSVSCSWHEGETLPPV